MYLPEYSITSKTLSNISIIEYGKAIIENTTILPSWESQLKKEAVVKIVHGSLQILGINIEQQKVKAAVDDINKTLNQEALNIIKGAFLATEISKNKEFEEVDLKYIHKTLTEGLVPKVKQGAYRTTKIPGKTKPEEILAQIVSLFDWYNSLDAKETHHVINAAIMKACLETIQPFEEMNEITSNLITYVSLKTSGYGFKDLISIENYYKNTKPEYRHEIESIDQDEPDLTRWIEYFTEGLASEVSTVSQNIRLLAKDTKIAKATGRTRVSKRQERIIEYLQDYGMLQNKDFPRIFPDLSEDTVLRDLKSLIDMDIVQKLGSTKSSRYELR
ncbi:Fic family protein [Patescibacteria group bacterium]|nr:Fic family protein [Patescibacteria group bacterium]